MRQPTHRVAARAPVVLAGGRPAAPGTLVTPDLERDGALIRAGALVPLASARRPRGRRRRAAGSPVRVAPAPEPTTTTEEDA